ncbi:MAG: CHRD domain-containing protein [Phycisphaerales bacterium]|nr:CHRD domain-containing protein [Phycisphaerales bacterium]
MTKALPIAVLSVLAAGGAHAHTWHYYFAMTAGQVATGSNSTAKGVGVLHYNHHNLRADLDLFISGLSLDDLLPHGPNNTPIHFHDAPNQQEGPIVTDLGWWGGFTQEQGGIRLTLSQFYLGGQQGQIYTDFGDVEYALYTNTIYAQVYTKEYPLGELRGQLIDRRFMGTFGDFFEENGFTVFGPVPAPHSAAVLGIGLLAYSRRRSRS